MEQLNGLIDPTVTSFEKLYKKVKDAKLKVKRKDVQDFWRSQSSVEVVRGKPASFESKKIKCWTGTIGCIQIDLMDISKYKGFNNQKTFLFNAVDIFSRRAWSAPISNKKPGTILPYVKQVVNDVRKMCPKCLITIYSDDGSEWKGVVSSWLKSEGIERVITLFKQNMAIVERFNKTLWQNFNIAFFAKNKFRFIDDLPSILKAYNETNKHAGIKQKPMDVWKDKKLPNHALEPEFDLTKPAGQDQPPSPIKIGDRVRRQTNRKTFDKASASTRFSQEIYEVVERQFNRFVLKNVSNGEILKTTYLPRELSITSSQVQVPQEPKKKLERESRVARRTAKEPAFKGVQPKPKSEVREVRKPVRFRKEVVAPEVKAVVPEVRVSERSKRVIKKPQRFRVGSGVVVGQIKFY